MFVFLNNQNMQNNIKKFKNIVCDFYKVLQFWKTFFTS